MRILFLTYPELAFFHLFTHASFKTVLFVCVGNLIHRMKNCQDIRCIGSFVTQIPLPTSLFSISNLTFCGFLFLSGFYSKALILRFSTKILPIEKFSRKQVRRGSFSPFHFRRIFMQQRVNGSLKRMINERAKERKNRAGGGRHFSISPLLCANQMANEKSL